MSGFDRFKIEWLLIGDLQPHPKVQRPFNAAHAKAIGDNFDPDKFRPLDVIARGPKFLVFAGQHRLAGARLALGDNQRVPCHVHEDVPIEKQAAICLGVDNMLGWKAIDRWHLRVMAQEEAPVKITAILAKHGLRVERTRGAGVIQAIGSLETVYTKHGGAAALDRVLGVLSMAYAGDKDAYEGLLVKGAGMLLHRSGDKIADGDFAAKLGRHSGPARLIGAARDYAKTTGISVQRAMADRMLAVYNSQRRVSRVSA